VEYVQTNYLQVRIISLTENTGFTGGNIAGYHEATGELIVLLNNDAVLTERWLEEMVTALLSDTTVGFCSSKIIIAGTDTVDSVGDTFTTAFTGTKMGEYEPESNFNTRRFVPGACAAAVIYKREMLDQIGFLDEEFFFNHEDTDLNLRAWLSGWRCLFVPEAVVYHKVSASVGELSDTGVYYFARNNVWVWIKNTPLRLMFRYFPQRIIYELSSFTFFCVKKGKWSPFLRGKIDAITKIPVMLNKRRDIQKIVKLSHREIEFGLMPITKYLMLRLQNMK
jgi:GT2 family glycosyltransferase